MHDPIPLPASGVAPGRAENPPSSALNPVPQPPVRPELRGGGSQPEAGPPHFPQAPGESARAFEAFRAYLELGPQRRYAAVARQVGASLSTVKRWAVDFDWRGRLKTHAAQIAGHRDELESTRQCENFLDAAARAKAFRDRQYILAEALLDAAERYLDRMEDWDLDQMNFVGACKALEIASRLGAQAAAQEAGDTAAPVHALRDQLATLLDQAYAETQSSAPSTTRS